ncbi:hypothetical protein, conserved, partial [Eimeria necatrix]
MPTFAGTSEKPVEYHLEPPTKGVARPAPRVWERGAGGQISPDTNQTCAEPGVTVSVRELVAMAREIAQVTQRSIGYEDGTNMKNFLDLAELDFLERGLEEQQWGEELKRHLKGDALGYWLYLRRTGEPMTDWEYLKQCLCEHFGCITKERMVALMAENVWRGDHRAYSARFAAIVAQGVSVAREHLVGFYLANLPDEIAQRLTEEGTRKFTDWQEAAAALAAMRAPWKDFCEDRLRYRREMEDAQRSQAYSRRDSGRNDIPDLRCYACSGRGHASRDCPLRNGATRRTGETCSR